jgi:hypothetical protein
MIYVKKIELKELPELVELSYKDDTDLFEKYHVAKMDLHRCVMSTLVMIGETARNYPLEYYKVLKGKKPIGYFIIFNECLYSFAINIHYRTKVVLKNWWRHVLEILGKHFMCSLNANNTRAVKFLERQGMKVISNDDVLIILSN